MYKIDEIKNTIIVGHALDELKKIPDNSINCMITSSPYYGLRSYGTVPQVWGGDRSCNHTWDNFIRPGISGGTKSKKVQIKDKDNFQIVGDSNQSFCSSCSAWLGELGQEPDYRMFINNLTEIFMECSRVLTDDGTMWINIADSYSGNASMPGSKKQDSNRGTRFVQTNKGNLDVKKKSLFGIPDRLKISLIDSGLICRNEITWRKPNQMPQSAKDRFTNDSEKIYFFTKSEKYFFTQQLEEYTKPLDRWAGDNLVADGKSDWDEGTGQSNYRNRNMRPNPSGRNMRTTWDINTVPNRVAHFATFPAELPKRCILAGCPEDGIVLDPFFGSGTTGIVAEKLKRNWIGIELNPEYAEIARNQLCK